MSVRVLVVDDSGFFRRRVSEMLKADARIEVVGSAANGREAIKQAAELKPDVITMDIEMPVMDGITAVRRIMAVKPTPILMFSSLTHEGAQSTFDALEAGAVDFLPKNFDELSNKREEVAKILCSRVWSIGVRGLPSKKTPTVARSKSTTTTRSNARTTVPGAASSAPVTARPSAAGGKGRHKLLAIGASTGGPVALQEVLTNLPASFSLPIVVVQHMPGSFTGAFAKRLDQMSKITIREARDGDLLEPGVALLAPGGKQMTIEGRGEVLRVRIHESEPGQNYKPCVDVTLTSIAKVLPANTLAIILTGMGADGREGARLLKRGGSAIWAQDEATSVIYGMPMAIVEAGLAEKILPLQDVSKQIVSHV
jgi:two-component system chemotaxis response regulator CheB